MHVTAVQVLSHPREHSGLRSVVAYSLDGWTGARTCSMSLVLEEKPRDKILYLSSEGVYSIYRLNVTSSLAPARFSVAKIAQPHGLLTTVCID